MRMFFQNLLSVLQKFQIKRYIFHWTHNDIIINKLKSIIMNIDSFIQVIMSNVEHLVALFLLISSGIYIRILLQIFGQAWIKLKLILQHY